MASAEDKQAREVMNSCFLDEVEHETLMTDSPGQPHAWSIYLAILDHFRQILAQLMDIVKILG